MPIQIIFYPDYLLPPTRSESQECSFHVASWSPGRQDVVELFVQTRRGITEKLRTRAALEEASFTAFVSGPYGRGEPVGQYDSVLAVASGFGIAGVVPCIKRLFYGYNTFSVRVCRVHLVWQVQTMGK
jgi:NAD(P)H-flavin reductase